MQNQPIPVPLEEQVDLAIQKLNKIVEEKGSFNRRDVFLCMQGFAEFMQEQVAALPEYSINTDELAHRASQNFGDFFPHGKDNLLRFCLTHSFFTAANEVLPPASEENVEDSKSEISEEYNLALLHAVNILEKKAKEQGQPSIEDIQSAFSRLSATALPTLKTETPTTGDDFAQFAFNQFYEESYSTFWRKLMYESIHHSINKAAKHFFTTNLSVEPFISKETVVDDEFLNTVPDNPLGYVSWAAQRIFKYGQFSVRANINVIRDQILLLNKLMYPPYETREEFENILNKNLALPPDIKAKELEVFDKEVSQLPILDAASISQLAKVRHELFINQFTEMMVSQMTRNFHSVNTRAIAANIMLSAFYTKYARAIDLGVPEDKASELRPTATTLKANVTDWLAQLLVEDFETREARGRRPKPEPSEQEKKDFAEKVISAILGFSKRPSLGQLAIRLKMSGNTARSQAKALERELERLTLSIEDLRYEARQQLRQN